MQITENIITLMDGVDENGIVRVKKITRYESESGEIIAEKIWRTTLQPGDAFDDPKIAEICAIVHTPEVIAKHQAKRAAAQAEVAVETDKAE